MSKITFIFLIILFNYARLISKEVLDYTISLDYIFDSNISRNVNEFNKDYLLPEIDFKLTSPNKIPFYLKGQLAFDHYLRERDFDDNSPFVSLGVGVNAGKKKLNLSSEIFGEYYMGFGYEKETDSESWNAVIRIAKWNNDVIYKKKRKTFGFKLEAGILDYGKDKNDVKSDKTAYAVEMAPSFSYKFKKRTENKIRVKKVSAEFKYEFTDAYHRKNDFNRVSLPLSLNVKFFRADIDSEIELSKKLYKNERIESISNKVVLPYYNRITLGSDISIPLISNLSVIVGGKLRFRDSNWQQFDYNRHTCHLLLQWQHEVDR